MIFLILNIVSTSIIFLIFRWLGHQRVNTFLVIVLNYLVAGLVGILVEGSRFFDVLFSAKWLWPAVILGSTFVGVFFLMSEATRRSGTASSVVANKMSVVIPVGVAFFFYGDQVHILKISGIALALLGIFYVTRRKGMEERVNKNALILISVFIGSGLIDTSIKYLETFYLTQDDIIIFTSALFTTAFICGLVVVFIRRNQLKIIQPVKLVGSGTVLGLVNFGSIYFLVLALRHSGLESSVLFPLNNIGVVLLSSLLSMILFGEEITKSKWWGIVFSILALVVLMFSA